ncbi:M28 family metallopeptidase [Rhizosphaericola mali]|uniref:M20/M25/M40 family metallo-hydrolase n=1 Tax=Rhizosphaericola mali TaxID=2545455 RepID=A0A5P2G415_9BACT|nr:M28 family peptidase [Rhizosphaericola mali]QES90574.1 M20/M25/M40 family metallo-hydrolase [Rhizosphaericola mali]
MIHSKKIRALLLGVASTTLVNAQNIDKIINPTSVKSILSVLASDDMRGRKTFSPDIDRAAEFIASEFKKTGLSYPKGQESYLQKFSVYKTSISSVKGTINNQAINSENILAVSTQKNIDVTQNNGYKIETIESKQVLFSIAMAAIHSKQNTIVIVDTSCSKLFKRLSYFTQATFESPYSVIFILGTQTPSTFDIHIEQNLEAQKLQNVVGIIPGKTKPDEYVIFSGHYDHLGVDPSKGTDSIYNGANDDASGTTAVIELAKYYKKLNNNERTLIFAAFTAEEIGGYGSQYFSQQFDPNKVIAMFNIEMIGTDSKWGNNSAYITGFEKTNMGEILQKNLQGSKFQFYPDPYTEQNLFYRSDNATLARQGVPAHTISTSKMDSEPNYHKLSDEISTLDLTNMAEIIKSVAVSAQTIISGKDTPTRVDASSLK